MRDWITALPAVLGSLMVVAGTTIHVVKNVAPAPVEDGTATSNSFIHRLRRLNSADRLILWGIVLLFLAAVAAGAISFNFGAQAGTQ